VVGIVVVPHETAADPTLAERLSPGDRERLASLDRAARSRFLAGRAALLRAAAAAGEPDVVIEALCPDCGASHGRPRATGASHPLHLALSHAAGSAFAVAARVPVGIDAEPLDTPELRRAAVDALAPGRGDALRRWTAIEAVLKADGRGLRLAPDAVLVQGGHAVLRDRRYRLRTTTADGCLVTVALGQRPSGGSAV